METYPIRPANVQCHIDLEDDLQKQPDGLFTFVIHVNSKDIIDYIVMSYENYAKPNVTRYSGVGSSQD